MRNKSIFYYTLEDMNGHIKLTCATRALAKMFYSQCGNEGICYKRKVGDKKYQKFAFMW